MANVPFLVFDKSSSKDIIFTGIRNISVEGYDRISTDDNIFLSLSGSCDFFLEKYLNYSSSSVDNLIKSISESVKNDIVTDITQSEGRRNIRYNNMEDIIKSYVKSSLAEVIAKDTYFE